MCYICCLRAACEGCMWLFVMINQSFFFNDTPTTYIYTDLHALSLHDTLPISGTSIPTSMTVVARGVGRPVAGDRLRQENSLLLADIEHALQRRTQLLARPLHVLLETAPGLPEAPLELVEHALVEIGRAHV